ncbi:tyrosine-type recombinase/integrase [Micromonospora sp. NPDC004551]|uniref:tyrosine-type recombinase/integrase n=1 Tax=Micromonospora sp. NPDC004551 TaxID=3154284 RepID=UPI0033A24CEE
MTDLDRFTTTALVAGELAAIESFTERWLANRRLSEATRTAYRHDVGLWTTWCAERDVDLLRATFLHVNERAREFEETPTRHGRPPAPSTVARRISAVSIWYDFLAKLAAVPTNPAKIAERPVVDRDYSPTVGFTAAEATAMLGVAAAGDRWLGAAAPPMAAMLVDLGVRVSDLCTLDVEHLGHRDGHRVVHLLQMKGGKRRTRSMPPAVAKLVDAYLAHRAAQAGVPVDRLTGPLFVTLTRERIDRHEVYRFVKRLAKAAGMPNWHQISTHSFRHAWNTIARDSGTDLEDRQHALGHKDPRTTQRYDRDRDNLDRDPSFLVAAATSGS